MSLIREALELSLLNHELIGLHTRPESIEKFSLGWITALSQNGYCLCSVDEYGGPDSIQIGLLGSIKRVSRFGPYIESMEDAVSGNVSFLNQVADFYSSEIHEALGDSIAKRKVVTVIDEWYTETTGLVVKASEEEFEIMVYDNANKYEGNEIIGIRDIYRIELCGRRERALEAYLREHQ